ncbi:MAG: zinc metalloprotease HtpX [Hyphomicrobiaceae bacterium]
MNFTKTALLLALLTGIFLAMGSAVGGQSGLVVAFVIAMVMNGLSLWKSDTIVLKMHNAQQVDRQTAPEFYGIVEALAARAELPMPKVFVMHNPQPNAFATGRSPSSAAVCASTGLMEMLSKEEVAAVMAHELAHIKNRDTLTMTVAATMGGAISMVAQWLQFSAIFGSGNRQGGSRLATFAAMLLAPFAAMIVQMAISRSREYQADRLGAMICGNPLWLASALEKIQGFARQIQNKTAESMPATAHLFIINPLTGRGMDSLFSTHPATENRIAELMKLAAEMGIAGGAAGTGMAPGTGAPQRPRGAWG